VGFSGTEGISRRQLSVLGALAGACAEKRSGSVPSHDVATRVGLSTQSASGLLRILRDAGFAKSVKPMPGDPVQWAPTEKGRAYLSSH
jgi:hypothetical protein